MRLRMRRPVTGESCVALIDSVGSANVVGGNNNHAIRTVVTRGRRQTESATTSPDEPADAPKRKHPDP